MNESISNSMTSAPLIRPTNSPMARTTTIAGNSDQPWLDLQDRDDHRRQRQHRRRSRGRSRRWSAAGSGPSARISSTAWEPKIVWKLPRRRVGVGLEQAEDDDDHAATRRSARSAGELDRVDAAVVTRRPLRSGSVSARGLWSVC